MLFLGACVSFLLEEESAQDRQSIKYSEQKLLIEVSMLKTAFMNSGGLEKKLSERGIKTCEEKQCSEGKKCMTAEGTRCWKRGKWNRLQNLPPAIVN